MVPIDTLTCEDTIDINLPGYMEHGYVKAVKTCRDWLASGEASTIGINKNHLGISGTTFFPYVSGKDTFYLWAESISFFVPKKTGVYPVKFGGNFLNDAATSGFIYLIDDTIIASWDTDTTNTSNVVEITELDLVNKRVKGKFEVAYTIDTTGLDYHRYPARLHFYNGEFDVEITD